MLGQLVRRGGVNSPSLGVFNEREQFSEGPVAIVV